MTFLSIILNLILIFGIHGLDTDASIGIDVLKTLKAKNVSCDLHDFIKSTDNTDDEYESFIHDLTTYCTNSQSTRQYRIICHMVLIELEIGCLLPTKLRPIPTKYSTAYTSLQICSMNKVSYANSWIWKKLSSNEQSRIGSTPIQLCPKIASINETLRLVRLFYKIGQRIRLADTSNTNSSSNKTSADVVAADKVSVNRTNENLIIKNKTNSMLESKQIRVDSNINKGGSVKDKLKKRNKSFGKKRVDNDNNANIIDSANPKDEENVQDVDDEEEEEAEDDDFDQDLPPQREANRKRVDESENNQENETKKNEIGIPLGRAGEKPEREQVNERPKPKALDVVAVYKADDPKELRNWVEGKKDDKQQENGLSGNLNRVHRIKLEENSFNNPILPRKKPSLRSRLSRYTGHDDDWSNNFITSFLFFILFVVIFYLVINNRNKILGLIIEGCRRNRVFHARRFGGSSYDKRHTRLSQSN